ncbi:MAG: hypothetical protein M0Z33_06825 [Actinomycetota bacterium]|nr:hypothetical protein [Actinomycetota bacterium]
MAAEAPTADTLAHQVVDGILEHLGEADERFERGRDPRTLVAADPAGVGADPGPGLRL